MPAAKKKLNETNIVELAKQFFLESLKDSTYTSLIKTSLGDDCFGFLPPSSFTITVTTDVLVEGVHFDLKWINPYELGQRAINVNFSDLASQGARPAFVFLGLGIKRGTTMRFWRKFYEGALSVCRTQGAVLGGGDTNSARELTIAVTAIGFATAEMKRSSARPGDLIAVTGKLGRAAAGYLALKKGLNDSALKSAVKSFLICQHRVEEGIKLAEAGVKCCEDISDGLARDLSNIATASDIGFVVYLEKIPVADELYYIRDQYGEEKIYEAALTFGDDYELVFTASEKVLQRAKEMGVDFTVIGKMTAEKKQLFIDEQGNETSIATGYLHHF